MEKANQLRDTLKPYKYPIAGTLGLLGLALLSKRIPNLMKFSNYRQMQQKSIAHEKYTHFNSR